MADPNLDPLDPDRFPGFKYFIPASPENGSRSNPKRFAKILYKATTPCQVQERVETLPPPPLIEGLRKRGGGVGRHGCASPNIYLVLAGWGGRGKHTFQSLPNSLYLVYSRS